MLLPLLNSVAMAVWLKMDGLRTAHKYSFAHRSPSLVQVKALNCRAGMSSSEYSDRIQHYYSPSNSSLLIVAPEEKLECSPNAPSKHMLPVLFSARDQPTAAITVQVGGGVAAAAAKLVLVVCNLRSTSPAPVPSSEL